MERNPTPSPWFIIIVMGTVLGSLLIACYAMNKAIEDLQTRVSVLEQRK